jgi:hypothetical protein
MSAKITVELSPADLAAVVAALDVVAGVEPVKHAAPHARRIETLRRRLRNTRTPEGDRVFRDPDGTEWTIQDGRRVPRG